MQKDVVQLPDNKDALTELVHQQQHALEQRGQKIEQQSHFIEQLLEQIRLARHQHFGSRSERFNIDQLALVFNEAEALLEQQLNDDESPASQADKTSGVAVPAHTRSRGGRRPLPAELPRVEIEHTLDEAERCCSSCDLVMEAVTEKASEQLDIIPAQVQVIRHVRKTYACKACDSTAKTAKLPPQPIPKSMASPWYFSSHRRE